MKTNEQIFDEIKATGFISESDLKLLKNRSNKNGIDLFDYSIEEIYITKEQGEKV